MLKRQYLLYVLLLFLTGWYIFQGVKFFQGALPFHAFDEYEYFLYARSFAETGSLKTPFLEQDSQSIVGQFGTHGFAYALLHGSINLLLGEHWWNIPSFNLLILLIGLIYLIRQKTIISTEEKILFILLFGTFFIIPIYAFSYMQESIHAFFAIIAGVLLLKIYQSSQNRKPFLITYITIILIATAFRVNWVIWIWAIYPCFKHKKIAFVCFALFLTLLAAIYLKLLQAPYVVGFLNQLSEVLKNEGLQQGIVFWLNHLTDNLYTYFRWYASLPFYLFTKYLILVVSVLLIWFGITRKNDLAFGVGIVTIFQIGALFLIYDTVYWRDVRMIAPNVIVIFLLAVTFHKKLVSLVLVLHLGCFYFLDDYTSKWIASHNATYSDFYQNDDIRSTFSKLSELIKEEEQIVLLRRSYAHDGQTFLFHLPFLNEDHAQIRYSVYYAPIDTAPKQLHNYMLLPKHFNRDNDSIMLIEKNNYYFLYKVRGENDYIEKSRLITK